MFGFIVDRKADEWRTSLGLTHYFCQPQYIECKQKPNCDHTTQTSKIVILQTFGDDAAHALEQLRVHVAKAMGLVHNHTSPWHLLLLLTKKKDEKR